MQMGWYDHVGPELKILKDLKQRLEIRTNTIHDDGFHAQYIWAIESLEKHLKIVNNEIPNEYHPKVQDKQKLIKPFAIGKPERKI